MELHEEVDIVIVGAGLAGLTTALALHRLGLKSLVLESSESLRITGFALTLWTNAWKALDAVGIGDSLRQKSTQIKGFKIASPERARYSSSSSLVDATSSSSSNSTTPRVLVGCDGVNSVVAKWLGLDPPISVGRAAIRGLAEFPNGSGFDPMFHVNFGGGTRFGFLPVDDKTVYWFCTLNPSQIPTYEEDWQENPSKMKQFVLSRINKMPQEAQDVVERTLLSCISYATLKFRLPWNVLLGNIVKDNVCVAGDALHPMTPDIGQGGCSSLEDSIVLGRCLGEAFLNKSNEKNDEFERIKKGLEKYGKERRWRSFNIISVAYCVGFIQESKGFLMSYLRKVWFSSYTSSAFLKMANFDCGNLVS